MLCCITLDIHTEICKLEVVGEFLEIDSNFSRNILFLKYKNLYVLFNVGCHNIAEILLKLALNTNQSCNVGLVHFYQAQHTE